MSNRGQSFVVEIKRKPNADYASRAGDARRSGRAAPAAPSRAAALVAVEFKDLGAQIEARLGVVVVGSVTHDPASGAYFWAIFLPGMPRAPRPAADSDKGKAAIAHKVREWCEAAKLISTRRD